MDFKGFQYRGIIHPGPTALIASVNKTGQLKVESLTDEFVTLEKTHDVMARLDAQVKGDMDEGYGAGGHANDANVNAPARGSGSGTVGADGGAAGNGGKSSKSKKRGGGGGGGKAAAGTTTSAKKKRKITSKK